MAQPVEVMDMWRTLWIVCPEGNQPGCESRRHLRQGQGPHRHARRRSVFETTTSGLRGDEFADHQGNDDRYDQTKTIEYASNEYDRIDRNPVTAKKIGMKKESPKNFNFFAGLS
jgi:hypothetical protein